MLDDELQRREAMLNPKTNRFSRLLRLVAYAHELQENERKIFLASPNEDFSKIWIRKDKCTVRAETLSQNADTSFPEPKHNEEANLEIMRSSLNALKS